MRVSSWVTVNPTPNRCRLGHSTSTRATHVVKWPYGSVGLAPAFRELQERARLRQHVCGAHAREITAYMHLIGCRVRSYRVKP